MWSSLLASLPENVWRFSGVDKAKLTRHDVPWQPKESLAMTGYE